PPAMRQPFANVPVPLARNPDHGQQIRLQQSGQHDSINLVRLPAGGGDRFGALRMREDHMVTQASRRIHEPPPGGRRLHRDRRTGGQPCQGAFHACAVVREASLGWGPPLSQQRQLSYSLVQIRPSNMVHTWPPCKVWSLFYDKPPCEATSFMGSSL